MFKVAQDKLLIPFFPFFFFLGEGAIFLEITNLVKRGRIANNTWETTDDIYEHIFINKEWQLEKRMLRTRSSRCEHEGHVE